VLRAVKRTKTRLRKSFGVKDVKRRKTKTSQKSTERSKNGILRQCAVCSLDPRALELEYEIMDLRGENLFAPLPLAAPFLPGT
jgi:hypothetical protein